MRDIRRFSFFQYYFNLGYFFSMTAGYLSGLLTGQSPRESMSLAFKCAVSSLMSDMPVPDALGQNDVHLTPAFVIQLWFCSFCCFLIGFGIMSDVCFYEEVLHSIWEWGLSFPADLDDIWTAEYAFKSDVILLVLSVIMTRPQVSQTAEDNLQEPSKVLTDPPFQR